LQPAARHRACIGIAQVPPFFAHEYVRKEGRLDEKQACHAQGIGNASTSFVVAWPHVQRRAAMRAVRHGTAEDKIKGRGTTVRAKPVCTWGCRGTRRIRHRAIGMRQAA
jgi:hypothetical protein